MSVTVVLAIVGGIIVVFYLLKLFWTCWHGLQEYFLSEIWKVDLRRYGQWAGKVRENIFCVLEENAYVERQNANNVKPIVFSI